MYIRNALWKSYSSTQSYWISEIKKLYLFIK